MAVTSTIDAAPAAAAARDQAAPIPVRTITTADLKAALRDGYADFLELRGDLMIVGLIYPLIGVVAAVMALGGALVPLFLASR